MIEIDRRKRKIREGGYFLNVRESEGARACVCGKLNKTYIKVIHEFLASVPHPKGDN